MPKDILLTLPGCPTCEDVKKADICDAMKCISTSSKKGMKLLKKTKTKYLPQRLCYTKDGRLVKCATTPILKKYLKKKRKK